MSELDDLIALQAKRNATPPVPAPVTPVTTAPADPNALTSEVLQETEVKTDIENKDDRGFFDKVGSFAQGIWDFGGSVLGGAADITEHFFQNEDDDKGINNWDRYKQYTKDISTGDYTTEQIAQKKRELYNDKVITDKYIMNEQEAASRPVQNATSAQELEQRVRRNLTAQLAPQMATNPSQDVVKILNQAIETQTKTYMDYYNRISESDDAMDKDKYYDQLADFMEKGKTFIRDYADNVLKTEDNQQAYYAAEEKNMEFVKDMDGFNSALTTSSQWAGLKGATSRLLFDGELNSNDIPNAWGVVVGLLGNAGHTLLGRPLHGVKMLTGGWNSGFEELRNDYIEKADDSFFDKSLGNMRFAVQEIVDGSDTLLAAAIPVIVELFVPGAQIGLLSSVEKASRLVSSTSKIAKAGTFLKTLGVQQLQNAVFFDNLFQTFQRRGYNLEDLKTNLTTNLVMDSLFVSLFMKPVLKGTEEFRRVLQDSGYNALNFADEEAVIVAANAGKSREVEHNIRLNVVRAQNGEEFAPAITRPTEEGARIISRANAKLSSGMKAIVENQTSEEGFNELIKYNTAINKKPGIMLTEETLQKKEDAQAALLDAAVTDKKYVGKHTLASMEETPDVERIVAAAIAKTMADSAPLAGTEYEFTQKMANALQQKLVDSRRGIASELNELELLHANRVMESLVDVVKAETDIQHLFPDGVLPAVSLSSASKTFKSLPGYTELAAKLKDGIEPKNYGEHVRMSIDSAAGEKLFIDSILPDIVPPQFSSFVERVLKNFGDKERNLDVSQVQIALNNIPGKTSFTDSDMDVLKLYHIGSLYDNLSRLKEADTLGEISENTLLKSHPLFGLFDKGEDGIWKPTVSIRDARDINEALGNLFQKNTLERVKEMPIIKTILKDTKFKGELQKTFTEIVKTSSDYTGSNIWTLVNGLLMDPVTMKQIEKLYVEDAVSGKAILEEYVLKTVRKNIELEGAYYQAWLNNLPKTPFFSEAPYITYARHFDTSLDALLSTAPKSVDKVKLKNNMLGLGADELVRLNQSDYKAAIYSYNRSALAPAIELLESLKKEYALPTTSLDAKVLLRERIAQGEQYVSSRIDKLNKSPATKDNVTQVLLALRKNPTLVQPWTEVLAENSKVTVALNNIIAAQGAVAFEKGRDLLRNALMTTKLSEKEFTDLQHLLLLPKSILGDLTEYKKTIESLKAGDIEKPILFYEAITRNQLFAGTKNIEEAYDILKNAYNNYTKTSIEIQAETIKAQNKSSMPAHMARKGFIQKTPADVAEIQSRSIVIVGYNKNLPIGAATHEIKNATNNFYTPLEFAKVLQEPVMRKELLAGKYGKVYITENALDDYLRIYKSKSTVVESETKGFQDLFTLLAGKGQDGGIMSVLPVRLAKEYGTPAQYVFTGSLDVDVVLKLKDSTLLSSETVQELGESLKKYAKNIDVANLATPISAKRAETLLDQVMDVDEFTGLLWYSIKETFPKKGSIDVLKYARGPDFEKHYAKFQNTALNLFKRQFPGADKLDEWFIRGMTLDKNQYQAFSRMRIAAMDSGQPVNEIFEKFTNVIKRNFVERIVANDWQAQSFATFSILNSLKRNNVTVPFDMTTLQLIKLVGGLDKDTVRAIGNLGRQFINTDSIAGTSEEVMKQWVAVIESALKKDSYIAVNQQSNGWALAGEISSEKVDGFLGETVDDYTGKAIASDTQTDEFGGIYIQKDGEWQLDDQIAETYKETDLERFLASIKHLQDKDPELWRSEVRKSFPHLLGEGTPIEKAAARENALLGEGLTEKLEQQYGKWPLIFQSVGNSLEKTLTEVTRNVYTGSSFNTYINMERNVVELMKIPENKALFEAYTKISEPKTISFIDAKRYITNPKAIEQDWDTVNFYINGALVTSKDQAKTEILIALSRQVDSPTEMAFNMVAVPKKSKFAISPSDVSPVGVKVLKDGVSTYVDKAELKGAAAFLRGGRDFLDNPLVKWAFSEELKAPFISLVSLAQPWYELAPRTWNLTEAEKMRKKVWDSILKYSSLDTDAPLRLTKFEQVEETWAQKRLKGFIADKINLEKDDVIKSVTLLEYKPIGIITDPDTGELIRYVTAAKPMKSEDVLIDGNFSDFFNKKDIGDFNKVVDSTTFDDLIEGGTFLIKTQNGRELEYARNSFGIIENIYIADVKAKFSRVSYDWTDEEVDDIIAIGEKNNPKYWYAMTQRQGRYDMMHNSKVGDFFRDWANFSLERTETPQLSNKELIARIHERYTVREERSFGNLLDIAKENSSNSFLKELSDILESHNIIKKEEMVYVGAPKDSTNGGSSIRGANKSIMAINSIVLDNANTSGDYFLEVLLHEKAHEFTSQIIRTKVNFDGKAFTRDASAKMTKKEEVYIDALTNMHSEFLGKLSEEEAAKFGYYTNDLAEFAVAFTRPEIAKRMQEIEYMDMNLLEYLTKKFLEFIGVKPTMYDSMVANYMNFVTDYAPTPRPFTLSDEMSRIHNFGDDLELEDLIEVPRRDRTWRKDEEGRFIRNTPAQIKSQYDTQIKALKNTAEKIAAADPKTLQVWENMRTGKIDVLSGDVGLVAGAKHIQEEYEEALQYAVKVSGTSKRTSEDITGFTQYPGSNVSFLQATVDGETFYTYQNIIGVKILEDYTQRIQDEYSEKMIAYFRDNTPESVAARLTSDIEDIEAAKQAHLMREEAFGNKKSSNGTKTNLDEIDMTSNAHINKKQQAISDQQEQDFGKTLDLLNMAEESIPRSDVPVVGKPTRTAFQWIADKIQVNNRALFDIHTREGWYSNATGAVTRLQQGMAGQGKKIMADFSAVSQDMLLRSDVSPLDYIAAISYSAKPQIFWEMLDEYRRGYNGANYSSSVFETLVSKRPVEEQTILRASKQEFKNAFTNGTTIANKGDIFDRVSPEYRGAVERFISYAQDKNIIDPLVFFFGKARNKGDFVRKAMEHDSFIGLLKDMHSTGYYNQVKEVLSERGVKINLTTDMLVDKYVLDNIQRVQPNLDILAQQKNRDILLVKAADKERKVEGFSKYLRAFVRETRAISTIAKFTVNPSAGIIVGGQNLFTNIFQAAGASKGMNPYYRDHEVIQYMLDTGLLEGNLPQAHLDNMNGVSGVQARTLIEKLYDSTAGKAGYWIAAHTPTEAGKDLAGKGVKLTKDIAMTGWHNAQDPMMQGTHMRIGLAEALFDIAGDDFDGALWMLKNNKMPDTMFNRFITRARELGESGNNAFTSDVNRRHILSGSEGWKLAFSYLQGYHMQRLGELTAGIKKLADAQAAGEVSFLDWKTVREHLWQQNPELRKFIGITFNTIHTGFFLDHYYDDEDTQNSLDYAKLFHEYINTFQANTFGKIISTAVGAHRGKEIYEDATGKELTFYQGISLETMDFLDAIPAMMFRELDVYKFIPKLANAYFTGDVVMDAALKKEMLDAAFSGNYRYGMPTGENTFGLTAMPESDDIIGSLLLGMHKTNASVVLADKLYAVTNADKLINGTDKNEVEDAWFYKTLKALPFVEYFTQNSRSKSAEWAVLKSLMTTDPIMKGLYARDNDIFTQYINQFVGIPEKYTSEVNEFWNDLTAFNYGQWNKKDLGTTRKDDFYDNKFDEEAKEELFTTMLENKLGKDFVANINTEIEQYIFDESGRNETTLGADILKSKMPGPTGDQMGIQKLMVTAESLQPGSAKVLTAYIANKKWFEYAQKYGPKNAKGYPDTTAFKNTDESTQVKKAILDEMFPNVYLADKTSYLKIIRNQAKNKYPQVFEKMSDSSKSLINTMTLNAFMAYQEILSGKPSAGNINSMVVASTKYIKNDADRLMALNYGLRGIYSLPATLDEKDMAATGMLYSNVDMLHRLANDEEFKKEYPGQVEYAAEKLFGIADKAALVGGNIHAMLEADLDAAGKQSYYNTYGSAYSQRPYNSTNKSIQDKLVDKANSQGAGGARALYNPGGASYSRPMNIATASQMAAIPRPQILDSYYRLAREQGVSSITSPTLLKQTVKRNLESESGGYKQPQFTGYKKLIAAPKPSVKKLRTANIKKRGPNVQLPLGLINIG